MTKSIKNAQSTTLFRANSKDPFYNNIKNNKLQWSTDAKYYWQNLYGLLQSFLDNDFAFGLAEDSFSRLWELTTAHFLSAHSAKVRGLCQACVVVLFQN